MHVAILNSLNLSADQDGMAHTSQNTTPTSDAALDACKTRIEARLGWGDATEWTSQDFEELSQRIQAQTGRVISATTLKRIWGRIAYNSRPSQHSLTTLAAFLGYDSWRAFAGTLSAEATAIRPTPAPQPQRWKTYALGATLLAGGIVVAWLAITHLSATDNDIRVTSDVYFRSRPVAQGVPNTVIFEYDVRGVQADSFFIQQSWDPRRRTPISPANQTLTSIYYHPGYFEAKLIANDSILLEHPVHIKTDGWVITRERDLIPEYITERNPVTDGFLSISKTWLTTQADGLPVNEQVFSFFNVRDFGDVHTDRFSLETAVRREMPDDRFPCQGAQLTVMGEYNMLLIPFGNPGCVGAMSLILGDVFVDGRTHDLSPLGTDLSTWQTLRLNVDNRDVTIQIGTNPPYTQRFQTDLGKVVGLSYHFAGVGAIDYVKVFDAKGESVYNDSF